jgi:hypothetical protein
MSEKERQLKRVAMELVLISSDSLDTLKIIEQFQEKNMTEAQIEEICRSGVEKIKLINGHVKKIMDEIQAIAKNSAQW